jgi:hypothetical protein
MATASSARTRKTAASNRAKSQPGRALAGVQPVELFTVDAAEREPDLVHIFSIDGVPYHMDRNQDASVALQYLKLVRSRGENVALSFMIEEVMGEKAYEALMNYKGITPAQLGQVMLAVQTVLLGSGDLAPKV